MKPQETLVSRSRGCDDVTGDVSNRHGNLGRKQEVRAVRKILPGLEYFIEYATWNTVHGLLQKWSCSPNLHVSVGKGSGQILAPFSISSQHFFSVCAELGFTRSFLDKVVAKAPMFEYRFDFPGPANPSPPARHLEIAMSTFENDSFFCLLRYDLKERSSKVLIFLKDMDHLRVKPRRPLLVSNLLSWLHSNQSILKRHPLMILNVILGFIQHEAHEYVLWRLELYSLESRLGVTRDGDSLKSGGYAEVDHNFTLLNADLAGLAKKFADTELSASTILEHAKGLQRLVGYCEEYEAIHADGQSQSAKPIISEQKEEIQATIIRAELYLRNMKMAQDVLQSLSAVLYNRINKQDTDSMKTIAVVTLVFLPATFVSAIFSTGIFNFHASEPSDHPRTISKYGWVYLLVCLLSTALTLVSWVCWYLWGRVWLEKLKFSRILSNGRKDLVVSFEAQQDFKSPLSQTPSMSDQNGSGDDAGRIPPGTTTSQHKGAPSPPGAGFHGIIGENMGVNIGYPFKINESNQDSIYDESKTDLEAGPNSPGKTQPVEPSGPPRARFYGVIEGNEASLGSFQFNGPIGEDVKAGPKVGQIRARIPASMPNQPASDHIANFHGVTVGNLFSLSGSSGMLLGSTNQDSIKENDEASLEATQVPPIIIASQPEKSPSLPEAESDEIVLENRYPQFHGLVVGNYDIGSGLVRGNTYGSSEMRFSS